MYIVHFKVVKYVNVIMTPYMMICMRIYIYSLCHIQVKVR